MRLLTYVPMPVYVHHSSGGHIGENSALAIYIVCTAIVLPFHIWHLCLYLSKNRKRYDFEMMIWPAATLGWQALVQFLAIFILLISWVEKLLN